MGPDITTATLIADMVNAFLHDGAYVDRVRSAHPEIPVAL